MGCAIVRQLVIAVISCMMGRGQQIPTSLPEQLISALIASLKAKHITVPAAGMDGGMMGMVSIAIPATFALGTF